MRVAVVGSGPTGVAAATVLIERGHSVDMLDGGHASDTGDLAAALRDRLKRGLPPTRAQMDRLLGPLEAGRILGMLRGRLSGGQVEKRVLGSRFTFAGTDTALPLAGPPLPRSLAVGGLSNAWGAACYPLRPDDTRGWPIGEADLAPWYPRAQALLGVAAEADGLTEAYPLYDGCRPPTPDPASPTEALLAHWTAHAGELAAAGLCGGRARLAVSGPDDPETPCLRCGLCLFGCPTGAIWQAGRALDILAARPGFRHRPGWRVDRLERDAEGRWRPVGDGPDPGPFDAVVLAAGALADFRIAAASAGLDDAEAPLVENDMMVVPFRPAAGLRRRSARTFGLGEAVLAGTPGTVAEGPVHLQFYRVTAPLLGPLGGLYGRLPGPLRAAADLWLAPLLIGSAYFHSRDSRRIRLRARAQGGLQVDAPAEPRAAPAAARLLALLAEQRAATGLQPLARLRQLPPPGFSAHLGGTLPMRNRPGPLDCDARGRLAALPGVAVAGLAGFPEMPAQNPTLAAMANAMRIAALLG